MRKVDQNEGNPTYVQAPNSEDAVVAGSNAVVISGAYPDFREARSESVHPADVVFDLDLAADEGHVDTADQRPGGKQRPGCWQAVLLATPFESGKRPPEGVV